VSLDFEPRLTRDWDDPSVIGVGGYAAKGGYEALGRAVTMADADILELVKSSGLR
jgi:NADH-quinone oxidoreductase subunit F